MRYSIKYRSVSPEEFKEKIAKDCAEEVVGLYNHVCRSYGEWGATMSRARLDEDVIVLGVMSLNPMLTSPDLRIMAAIATGNIRLQTTKSKRLHKIYITAHSLPIDDLPDGTDEEE